ncbi:MAG: rRNA pseudouridine synthase [Candidatus Hydrogenedentes bacterium]|nr:rRNA pseudouridine synthase [Candidatus Hydrogenedentota bacterium]
MRLQRFLAECGLGSRRQCETFIREGRVRVDGEIAAIGDTVDPTRCRVELDGAHVNRAEKVYVLLHKPKGVVTTLEDTHDRPTVVDCLHGLETRVAPVGRLDMDVTGTLLLTNDGELAHRLTHPKHEIDKTYLVQVKGCVSPERVAELEQGVVLEDGKTAPARVSLLEAQPSRSRIRLVIHEGRKRMVKRMCEAIGHPVLELHRTAVGPISADDLDAGAWRHLSQEEVTALKTLVGFTQDDT